MALYLQPLRETIIKFAVDAGGPVLAPPPLSPPLKTTTPATRRYLRVKFFGLFSYVDINSALNINEGSR